MSRKKAAKRRKDRSMVLEPALTFQDEADFTSCFLVPLLRHLGYLIVAKYHGQREYGKDLVFGEIDRFGEVSYHGLQAKYVDSIGQKESEGLIDDYRQAFRHPFRHPNTGDEHRINTFIVANAGNIADNARTNFFTAATNDEHGGNVRMFDGKALLALDRWATINRVEQMGETLSGLLIELGNNNNILVYMSRNLYAFLEGPMEAVPPQRLRTTALSHYIQKPLLPSQIDTGVANQYLTLVELINDALDGLRFDNMVARLTQDNSIVEGAGKSILGLTENLASPAGQLESSIKAALATLDPLAAL